MNKDFFPQKPNAKPMIYAYEDSNPQYAGYLKIGYTTIGVEERVKQQYPTLRPSGTTPYKIVFAESAMYTDGGNFMDHDIHRYLDKKGFKNVGGEWYKCTVNDVRAEYNDAHEEEFAKYSGRTKQQAWCVLTATSSGRHEATIVKGIKLKVELIG